MGKKVTVTKMTTSPYPVYCVGCTKKIEPQQVTRKRICKSCRKKK